MFFWYMCRAPVMTPVAETVYATDITMSEWESARRDWSKERTHS